MNIKRSSSTYEHMNIMVAWITWWLGFMATYEHQKIIIHMLRTKKMPRTKKDASNHDPDPKDDASDIGLKMLQMLRLKMLRKDAIRSTRSKYVCFQFF
ncbi:hypothetical protein Hanom_Chr05g00392821 [Helianthus anomalus]